MSLLSIAQDVTALVGIQPPPSIAINTDTIYGQVRAIIQQAADELYRRHDWQALARLRPYTTVAGEVQPGLLPADYGRMAAGQTLRDTATRDEISGPLSPTEWADVHWLPSTGMRYWRFIGRDVYLYPAPAVGQKLTFEYLTRNHVQHVDGSFSDRFKADDDVSLLPESLIILSAIWRWKSAKGFAYAEDMQNYERELERISGAEAASGTIVVADSRRWPFDPYAASGTPSGPFISSTSIKSSAI